MNCAGFDPDLEVNSSRYTTFEWRDEERKETRQEVVFKDKFIN